MQSEDIAVAPAVTVVDDEPLALDVLIRAARSWRYECQAAANAEQALQLFERRQTPLLVTDLRMPGRGGIWLVGEIHRRWPDVGIIVVTAGDDSQAAINCLNAGADRYFLKPVHLDEFHHALDATFQAYQLKHDRERHRSQLERKVRQQTRRIRRDFLSSIDSIVRTLEERDPYTAGHSKRVRALSVRLANCIALGRQERHLLGLAAKLHDIGKHGIPEVILHKPARLTAAEDELIRQHPLIGVRILKPIVRNRTVLAAIRGHHERMDGTGYPDGLVGEQIPLLARMIAIVDCYDALTSSRAYRPPLPHHRALEFMSDGAGTHFDSQLLTAFCGMMRDAPSETSSHALPAAISLAYPVQDEPLI
jgi:response regulator RpfG family c-di-GMP phosphodiesterase